MTDNERYQNFAEGYKFSFKVLEALKPELYDFLVYAINLSDQQSCSFSELIKNLKIDFINDQTKEVGIVKGVIFDKDLKQYVVAMSYAPLYDFALLFHITEKSFLGEKKVLYQIYPVKSNNSKEIMSLCLGVTKFKDNKVARMEQYYTFKYDDTINVLYQNVDRPDKMKLKAQIPIKEFEENDLNISFL